MTYPSIDGHKVAQVVRDLRETCERKNERTMNTQLIISALIILAMIITNRFDFKVKIRNEFKSGTRLKSRVTSN